MELVRTLDRSFEIACYPIEAPPLQCWWGLLKGCQERHLTGSNPTHVCIEVERFTLPVLAPLTMLSDKMLFLHPKAFLPSYADNCIEILRSNGALNSIYTDSCSSWVKTGTLDDELLATSGVATNSADFRYCRQDFVEVAITIFNWADSRRIFVLIGISRSMEPGS